MRKFKIIITVFILCCFALVSNRIDVSANTTNFSSSMTFNKNTIDYNNPLSGSVSFSFFDASSGLKNGIIEIDTKGLRPEPLEVNAVVKSSTYDVATSKLKVILQDNVSSGNIYNFTILFKLQGAIPYGTEKEMSYTITGTNSTGTVYPPEVFGAEKVTTIQVINPVTAAKDWKATNPQNITQSMNTLASFQYNYSPNTTKKTFNNMRIVVDYTNVNFVTPGDFIPRYLDGSFLSMPYTSKDLGNNRYEYTVGNVGNDKIDTYAMLIYARPKALGTYTLPVQLYDGDLLVETTNINYTIVNPPTQTVELNPYQSRSNIIEKDIFSWNWKYRALNVQSPGIKNMVSSMDIPQGIKLREIGFIAQIQGLTPKIEYFQNNSWKVASLKNAAGTGYDFIEYGKTGRIESIRATFTSKSGNEYYHDTNLMPLYFENESFKVGEKINLKMKQFEYTDQNNNIITDNLNLAKYSATFNVVEPYVGTLKAKAFKFIGPSTGLNTDATVSNTLRVGTNEKTPFDTPYAYLVLPDQVAIDTYSATIQGGGENRFEVQAGIAPDIPTGDPNIDYKIYPMSNNRKLYVWSLPNGTMSTNRNGVVWLGLEYKLKILPGNLTNMTYEVGGGSLKGSLIADPVTQNVNNSFMNLATLDDEIKTLIPNLENNKVFKATQSLQVNPSTAIRTTFEAKGSEDAKYVDSTKIDATSVPGKIVDYRITLQNYGTTEMSNIEFIDIIPYLNDTNILTNNQRGSRYNMIATSNFVLKLNDVVNPDVYMEYSTSTSPERFDTAGIDVVGDEWSKEMPLDASEIKAVRIKSTSNKLTAGDKITLEYKLIMPVDAPRNGEVAYNTIAYRADGIDSNGKNIKLVSEPPKAGVKAIAPKTNHSISGRSYNDINKNGIQDPTETGLNGIEIEIYKKTNGLFTFNSSTISSPITATDAGKYAFNGLVTNDVYKVRVKKPESSEFITNGSNTLIVDQNDPNYAWVTRNGVSEFVFDDLDVTPLIPVSITDLNIPLYVKTEISGKLNFLDKNNIDVNSSLDYSNSFDVELYDKNNVKLATTQVGENGTYSFGKLDLNSGSYNVKFVSKVGNNLARASKNTQVNSNLIASIPRMVAGIGAKINFNVTDIDFPSAVIVVDKVYNPTSIKINSFDQTTSTSNMWEIFKGGKLVAEGIGSDVTVPINDGVYEIRVSTNDQALNNYLTSKIIYIDTIPPTVVIDIDQSFNPNYISINVIDESPTTISWKLFSKTTQLEVGRGNGKIVELPLFDDQFELRVTVTDAANNFTEEFIDFEINESGPNFQISFDKVINPTYLNIRTLDLTANYSWKLTSKNGVVEGTSLSIPVPLEDGLFELTAYGTETTGELLTTTKKITFVVDKTLPVIEFELDSDLNPTTTNLNIIEESKYKVEWKIINLANNVVTTSGNNQSVLLPNTDGNYKVVIKVVDEAENIATFEKEFINDFTPPEIIASVDSLFNPKVLNLEVKDLTKTSSTWIIYDENNLEVSNGVENNVDFPTTSGNYSLKITAVDEVGNTANKIVSFKIDNINPIVTTSIDRQLNPTQAIIAVDELNLQEIKWEIYNQNNLLIRSGIGSKVSFPTGDGKYVLKVIATDLAGNIGTSNNQFDIDKSKPQISLSIDSKINPKNISFKITDNNFTTFFYEIKDINGNLIESDITENVKIPSTDGIYSLYIKATDVVGNISEVADTFTVDNTPPNIEIDTDLNVNPSFINIKTNDLTLVKYTWNLYDFNNKLVISGTSSNVEIPSLDMQYRLEVIAKDGADNESSVEHKFTIDLNGPSIDVKLDNMYNPKTVEIISVDQSINTYVWSIIDHQNNTVSEGSGTNVIFPGNEGHYYLSVIATDEQGRSSTKQVEFYIDISAPKIMVEFDRVINPILANVSVEDLTKTVTNWEISNINKRASVASGTGNSVELPSIDGTYVLTVEVTDAVGLLTTEVKEFIIDTIAPQVKISFDQIVNPNVLNYNIIDSTETKLSWKIVNSNNEIIDQGNNELISDSIVFASYEDGIYQILITTTDQSANSFELNDFFIVDKTNPVTTVGFKDLIIKLNEAPTEKNVIDAMMLSSIDNSSSFIHFNRSEEFLKKFILGDIKYKVNLSKVNFKRAGIYDFEITATDFANNVESITATIKVEDNKTVDPTDGQENPQENTETNNSDPLNSNEQIEEVTNNSAETVNKVASENKVKKILTTGILEKENAMLLILLVLLVIALIFRKNMKRGK